jgi:ADP-ribose pyrophosphatase YjhB (NUDIX family)
MNSYNELKVISDFKPFEGEACFPPSVLKEYAGGMHIAPECVTVFGDKFIMVEWPNGLPRHETNHTVRFPHGLMNFGESIDEAASRLVMKQMGLNVTDIECLKIDSYLDEHRHWHFEPVVLARVHGEPQLPKHASRFVYFWYDNLPAKSVWGRQSFRTIAEAKILPIVPNLEA